MASNSGKCADKYGVALGAYNSVIGSKRLCGVLQELNLVTQCPPPPEVIDALDKQILCAIFCCCLEQLNDPSHTAGRNYQRCVISTIKRGQQLDINMPAYRMLHEGTYNLGFNPVKPLGKAQNGGGFNPDNYTRTGNDAIRRVDVVVRNGDGPASGDNIRKIYEMKFPRDAYGPGQKEDYETIAGDSDKLKTLNEQECCSGANKKGDEVLQKVAQAQRERGVDFFKKVALLGVGGSGALGGLAGLGGRILGGLGLGGAGGMLAAQ